MRPSMINTLCTPHRIASTQHSTFGIIPPDTITAQTINEYFVTTETTIKNSKAILVIASKV